MVGKISVIESRNCEHADEVIQGGEEDGKRAPSDPKYPERRDMEQNKGDIVHPVYPFLSLSDFFAQDEKAISPLTNAGDPCMKYSSHNRTPRTRTGKIL
jgi:hypothetical protein